MRKIKEDAARYSLQRATDCRQFGLVPLSVVSSCVLFSYSVGTPAYMAPEQINGLDLDARSDLFSLGSVLYKAATGRAAFAAPTLSGMLAAVGEKNPPSARTVNPAVPVELSDLIERLHRKNPSDRPASSAEVVDDLRRMEAGFETPTTDEQRARLESRRRSRWHSLGRIRFALTLGPVRIAFTATLCLLLIFVIIFPVGIREERMAKERESATELARTSESAELISEKMAKERELAEKLALARTREESILAEKLARTRAAADLELAKGNRHADEHKLDLAVADYDRAIQIDPEMAAAYARRGETYHLMKNDSKALGDLNRAISMNPQDAVAWNVRGSINLNKQLYDQAQADFDRAVAVDPKLAEAFDNRAVVLFHKKEYDLALKDLDRAIELNNRSARAYFHRGLINHEKAHPNDAIRDFTRAIDLDPDFVEAYLARATSRDTLGRSGRLSKADREKATQIEATRKE